MARPQQPELARSGKTDIDPDHVETGLQGQPTPATGGETGPVPPENQSGHHPAREQDKPDLDAFAAKLGTDPKAPAATKARKPPRPRATTVKAGASKAAGRKGAEGPVNSGQPAGDNRRTGKSGESAGVTRRTGAPPWPESAPAAADLGPLPDAVGMSAPRPEPDHDQHHEPRLVALALLPLRETVKRLEQLDRSLTERLAKQRRSARGGLGPKGR